VDYVEVQIGENRGLLVESNMDEGIVAAGRLRDISASTAQSFDCAIDSIRDAAIVAVERIMTLPQKPDEIALEFAVQLAAEAGVVIARTTATANFKVCLKWLAGDPDGKAQEVDRPSVEFH